MDNLPREIPKEVTKEIKEIIEAHKKGIAQSDETTKYFTNLTGAEQKYMVEESTHAVEQNAGHQGLKLLAKKLRELQTAFRN